MSGREATAVLLLFGAGAAAWWFMRTPPPPPCAGSFRDSDRVSITVPDGRHGTVPRDDLAQAIRAGATLDADGDQQVEIEPSTGGRCLVARATIEASLRQEEADRRRAEEESARAAAEAEAARLAAEHEAFVRLMTGARAGTVAAPAGTNGGVGYAAQPVPPAPYAGYDGYGGVVGGPSPTAGTDVNVRGHFRSNGTYVAPHTRAAPGRGSHR